jgi:hypothetical protein
MKKRKNETELFRDVSQAAVEYAEGRSIVKSEPHDPASEKLLYIYSLPVDDNVIAPMPEEQVVEKTLRHRADAWVFKATTQRPPTSEIERVRHTLSLFTGSFC